MKEIKYGGYDGLRYNFVPEDEYKEIAKTVINVMADTVALTAGPYGGNLFIQEPQVGNFMTKDGFTVLKNMNCPGDVSFSVFEVVKNISEGLVLTVGDASTSSILIGRNANNKIMESQSLKKKRPKDVMDTFQALTTVLGKIISGYIANPIDDELTQLLDIATISVNNDINLGKLIVKIYNEIGREGFINVKVADSEKTTYTISKGFQVNSGWLDALLITNPDTEESVLKDTDIIVFDTFLDHNRFIQMLNQIFAINSIERKSLVVVAPGYGKVISESFRNYFRTNLSGGYVPSVNIIALPCTTTEQREIFEDFYIKVGATPIRLSEDEDLKIDFSSRENYKSYLGHADCVKSTEKVTTFLGGNGSETAISARISEAKRKLEHKKTAEDVLGSELYHLKKRIAVLTDKLATILVGGVSVQEQIANKALIDDAVAASKSAIEYGYVDGCNFAIIKAIEYVKEYLDWGKEIPEIKKELESLKELDLSILKELIEILLDSVIESHQLILKNADIFKSKEEILAMDKPENLVHKDRPVINSAQTEVEILKNVASIIGLIVTSKGCITKTPNSIIVDEEENKKE